MALSMSDAGSIDSDDDFDWEEVEVPLVPTPAELDVGPSTLQPGTIEITLQARKTPKQLDLECVVSYRTTGAQLTLHRTGRKQ